MATIPTLDPQFSWRLDSLDWPIRTEVGRGLAGVIAATTEVCWLDPSSGLLCYRSQAIEELAARPDFEAVAHLLITGEHGDPTHLERFRKVLRRGRTIPKDVIALIQDQPLEIHPTRLLRAGVSALGCHEMAAEDDLSGQQHWLEMRIVGQVVSLLGIIICHRRQLAPPTIPDQSSLAEGLLTVLLDRPPTALETKSLDLLWVLYAAHGMDAPTFTSMIVASCRADPYTNIVAGLSAMRGPRQGGTGEYVLRQFLQLEDPNHAREWVGDTIARGGRIAGFGHRLYAMPDPRVVMLRKAVASLARDVGRDDLFAIARAVEDEASRRLTAKGVHININFYASLLFHLLGAEAELVPCLFAAARLAGLIALVHESKETIRLHRPLASYVGRPARDLEP